MSNSVSYIPDILQFSEAVSGIGTPILVLILGNNMPPQIYNGTSLTPITNTFVPAYPTWTATSQYAVNSIVQPPTPNTFYYQVVQGGESGASTPTFPTVIGAQVADGQIIWVNKGTVQSSAPAPPGAAHGIVYAGSLWVFNTAPSDTSSGIDGPCSLRMSDVNNPLSWNPINQAFLDRNDGTVGMGLAAFTITAQGIPPEGSLVAFKNFATYQIIGVFGSANFAIQRIKSDMGCIAPRTIQFVPGFGVMRFTHLGFALFDGVDDRVVSAEIQPYLFPTNSSDVADITVVDANYSGISWSSQTANPPMYIAAMPIGVSNGTLTRLFCYDLVLKCWAITDLPFSISTMRQVRTPGTAPITLFGGYSDGVIQRWQAGDTQWYTNGGSAQIAVNWSERTPEIAASDSEQRLFIDRILLRGQNTNSVVPIVVSPTINGKSTGNPFKYNLPASGDFSIVAGVMRECMRANATISGSGNVELQGRSWDIVPKPSGVPSFVG